MILSQPISIFWQFYNFWHFLTIFDNFDNSDNVNLPIFNILLQHKNKHYKRFRPDAYLHIWGLHQKNNKIEILGHEK